MRSFYYWSLYHKTMVRGWVVVGTLAVGWVGERLGTGWGLPASHVLVHANMLSPLPQGRWGHLTKIFPFSMGNLTSLHYIRAFALPGSTESRPPPQVKVGQPAAGQPF